MTLRALLRTLMVGTGLLAGATTSVRAQFFVVDQNKVQYRRLDWRVMRGAHVDLYFYPAEAELAPVTLAYAEASFDTLALQFGHAIGARVPIIIYASHVDFEQTNVLPFTPPEGLLGVTDFTKRRVALPFRGNLAEFRHTLRHELVHAFQLSLFGEAYYQAPAGKRIQLPLWWTEGLAELWSGGEDARDEMILRDLTLTGRLPQLKQLTYYTGGLVYPIGGRVHRWLADTYGDWRVAQLYRELNRHETFEDAIRAIYGRSLDRLSDEWQLAMRREYYPTVERRAPLPLVAREIAELAIKPAYVADSSAEGLGDALYVSQRSGYLAVYRKPIGRGKATRILSGERSGALETFHPFDSRMDASRPGYLLFSVKSGERDALVIWDLKKRKVAGRYQFPELVSIVSPAWMPGGDAIVLSGLSESGISNLYRVRLPDGALAPLTDDRYQDLDPSPSPDGRTVVFSSDRGAGGIDGAMNLYLLDLETHGVRALTSGPWVDETPSWGADGRIYFSSSRDSVLNVFSVDTSGRGRRETSAWTGAFDPAPMPGKPGLLVSGFHDLSWNVYYYPVDSSARADAIARPDSVPAADWAWTPAADTATVMSAAEPYRRRFTLDFAAGGATIVPGFGGAQGIAFALSDILGDQVIFGSVASFQGKRLGSVFKNLNASAVYVNQRHRINWGVGAFRSAGRNFEGDLEVAYEETAYGVLGLLRYPLSRFNRVEGYTVVEHSDRTDFTLPVEEPRRIGWIASNYVAFVHDNSIWIPSGPIDGGRFAVTTGASSDFTNGRFDSYLASVDWRQYFRLGGHSAFALRGYGFYSGGDRPKRVNIGGTMGLRGYPNFGYIVGSRAFLFNSELRFPLLTHLTFGTPAGDIRFPEFQGALFFDLGRASFPTTGTRAALGSYGAGVRLALAPLIALRLDLGWRFAAGEGYGGYGLPNRDPSASFVNFFFGYNY